MVKTKRIPFDPNSDEAQEVINLYRRGKSVSTIAKQFHRGYPTILSFIESKNLYTGPANKTKKKVPLDIKVVETHQKRKQYYSLRHSAVAIFHGYYNDTCRVFLVVNQCYAYTKKEELIEEN